MELEESKDGTDGAMAQVAVCNAVPDCGREWPPGEQTSSRLLVEHSSSATILECISSVIETAKKSRTSAMLSALHS
jgi:hypothetical protein